VAVAASRFSVLAFQRKFRIARVVEAGIMPVGRVVAIVTLLTTAAIVGVV